jgi:uncharacterized protein with LGFP repeats
MTWAPEYASEVYAVAVHHTVNRNDYREDEVPGMLRAIYYFHAVSRGWGDIGYNVLVDRFGRAWEGRAGGMNNAVVGAHAGGFNTGTAGVALLGDYSSVDPPAEALETAARFIAYKLGSYGYDPRSDTVLHGGPSDKLPAGTNLPAPRVFPHKLTSATACPGGRLEAQLPWLRERASQLLANGRLQLTWT